MSEKITYTPITARKRVFLTGTPILNRPKEIWSIANALDPATFANYWRFAGRYCGGHKGRFGYDDSGATNLDELQEVLRSKFMVRRLKKDVLTDLPAKRRQVIEFPANGAAKEIAHEVVVVADAMRSLSKLRVMVELAKASEDPEDYRTAVAMLRDGASHAFQEIAAARRDTAIAKLPYVLEHLENCTDKVLVFAHHHAVIDKLVAALGSKCVAVTGKTPLEARQAAVDRFQSDPGCTVFVGNIKAAGVGLTLTAASHVIFAELTYTPADMQQAEDRAHRIGQRSSVLVQHLVLEGSIDANMARTLVQKMGVIEQALDTEHAMPDLTVPVLPDPPSTIDVTRIDITAEAKLLTPAQVTAIHTGLRMLAATDLDHAREINGIGFNKLDTEIGCSLAARATLSPKQAALGRKLVNKYRKQLPSVLVEQAVSDGA